MRSVLKLAGAVHHVFSCDRFKIFFFEMQSINVRAIYLASGNVVISSYINAQYYLDIMQDQVNHLSSQSPSSQSSTNNRASTFHSHSSKK
jgi:hypothetical protein